MSSNGGIAPSFEVRLAPVQRRVGRAQNGSGACAAADHAEAAKFTGQSEGSELGGHSSSCSPFGACAASLFARSRCSMSWRRKSWRRSYGAMAS